MEKRKLQKLLSQPYSQENWKQIVQFVFPNVSIRSTPYEYEINDNYVKKFRQIGDVKLDDGKNLALFELILAENIDLKRNRVGLNDRISKYIDQEGFHGVLSVFDQQGEDYRFTFSSKSTNYDADLEEIVQSQTDKKRFTYVLGKNQSCKTPAERFYSLSQKDEIKINNVIDAFNVENLSKEFFDKYKKQFEKFWKYIDSKEEYNNVFINGQGERQVKIRNFTKKLLGRIVFLHFLQKKGWMGCPENESWGSGDKKFMQSLFKDFTNKDQFHSQCLVELFYNTLNTKRDNFLFKCEGLEGILNNSKIPYLNGGLFDSDRLESTKIDFPESYFQGLFDFFGQYNFTIDENDPNDHEVGIDPEMLGHIFENLLEDNKDKGAFYTPKVIVQYMCQESLIEYLATKLEAEPSGEVKQAIEDLIRNRLAEDISDLDLVEPIAQALFDVKICDPAIGSGAFPMGILNVIYQVIEALYYLQPDSVARVWNISDTQWQPHLVKKNIIQHSIYGVDIESGAVDIARLRFWLALVVDEVEPLPLPNLDYKIMQGNSLLESFEGIDLSQISDAAAYEAVYESEQIDMFSGEAKKKVSMSLQFEDVKTLMDDYFNANDPETKKDLHKRIDDQVLNHIRFTLADHKRGLQKKAKKLEKKVSLDEASARTWEQKEKIRTNSKAAKALVKLNAELSQYNDKELKLAQLSNSNERPFFLWHLFFQEVFNKGGFDIVIGNPPYIGEKGNKDIFAPLKTSLLSDFYLRKMDYFYFFFHSGLNILKPKGILSYITTNYYVTATGATKLRNDFYNRGSLIRLVNFREAKIFPSALGQHNLITLLQKGVVDEETEIISVMCSGVLKESKCKKIFYDKDVDTAYFSRIKDRLYDGEQRYIRITSSGADDGENAVLDSILKKISTDKSQLIGSICSVNQGLRTGADKVSQKHIRDYSLDEKTFTKGEGIFILTESEVNSLALSKKEKERIKPLFKNSDIEKFKAAGSTKYRLIDVFWPNDRDIKIEEYPNLFKHLAKYRTILENRKENANGIDKAIAKGLYYFGSVRRKLDFSRTKIVSPQRSKTNKFAFTDGDWFASADVYYISSDNESVDLKYVLGILNSKLYYLWFYHRGKRKGEMLELYQKPLSETPILLEKDNSKITQIVNSIIEDKEKGKSTKQLKQKLDVVVCKHYDLDYEEFCMVCPDYVTDYDELKYSEILE